MRALNNNEYIGGGRIRRAYDMAYEGQVISENYRSGHQIHKDKLVDMGWDRSLFKIKFKK